MAGKDPSSYIEDGGSHVEVPKVPRDEMTQLTREEWLERYGDVLQSEEKYLARDPNWVTNTSSWWYKTTGRDGPEPPLWMKEEWHLPELDFQPGADRHTSTVDCRAARDDDGSEERPLWAERMNRTGDKQGPSSATIFGHRREYLPASKSGARSMYDRYQPSYQRIVNDEIPDTAAPPDGRFWKAGIAQGVTTNPYERRMALSGHRKPIVIGPRSINVIVDGEGHTLANMVRDVAWGHPDVAFAGYSLEHPVYRHMNLRIQTTSSNTADSGDARASKAEQALVESLETTQRMIHSVGSCMEDALQAYRNKGSPRHNPSISS